VLFSGNLERDIFTNPFFFGKEKVYLRAQIARIVHSTVIIPKGVMRTVEDNERETEENAPEEGEMVYPSAMSMSKPGMWVHKNLNILKNCRTAHVDPEEPTEPPVENWDVDEEKKKIEAADPYDIRLKPVDKDLQIQLTKQSKQSPWVIRLCGDATEYLDEKKAGAVTCNGTVVVRSLQWPGAYTFYQNEAWHQVYVGQGHKYEQAVSYFPVEPPTVIEDPEEFRLEPEPTPLEEPIVEVEAEAKPEGDDDAIVGDD
jgi:radial spoke head protein 4A